MRRLRHAGARASGVISYDHPRHQPRQPRPRRCEIGRAHTPGRRPEPSSSKPPVAHPRVEPPNPGRDEPPPPAERRRRRELVAARHRRLERDGYDAAPHQQHRRLRAACGPRRAAR
eukprot:1059415-Prymnesium_polylepis.1